MVQQKNHYYVLVFTNTGPVYVTGIPERNTAEWDRTKKPKELSKSTAEDMVLGLNLNSHGSVLVISKYEINNHPYWYEEGGFVWKWNKDEKNEGGV